MKSAEKKGIMENPQSHPGYLGLELTRDWCVPKRKTRHRQCSLRSPLWCTSGQQQVQQQEHEEDGK